MGVWYNIHLDRRRLTLPCRNYGPFWKKACWMVYGYRMKTELVPSSLSKLFEEPVLPWVWKFTQIWSTVGKLRVSGFTKKRGLFCSMSRKGTCYDMLLWCPRLRSKVIFYCFPNFFLLLYLPMVFYSLKDNVTLKYKISFVAVDILV